MKREEVPLLSKSHTWNDSCVISLLTIIDSFSYLKIIPSFFTIHFLATN